LRVRQAETTMRESESRLRALIEAEPECVMLVGCDGEVLEMNPAGLAMIEAEHTLAIVGHSLDPIVTPAYREAFRALVHRVCEGQTGTLEFEIIGLRGSYRWLEMRAVPFRNASEDTLVLLGITRDITQRKAAEERILGALREKEVLLKEIHHRVKNNLQIVSSLLSLQANQIQDQQAREMLKETQRRVKSMSFIHERLYRSSNLAQIDFAEYIRELANDLLHSYHISADRITLGLTLADALLSIETALPCGLILNELISNCLKHAFPAGRTGEIRIELHSRPDGMFVLTVSDNGIGLPQGLDFRTTTSLGLQLVVTLTEQVRGTIELDRHEGTTFRLLFAEPAHPTKG
ncbi:MAG: sensor histidine kinase, partial [Candidatus Entotheonellia bacterium]